jgi:hypothetical protein
VEENNLAVNITAAYVRNLLNITSTDISDAVMQQFITEAEEYIEEKTGQSITITAVSGAAVRAISHISASFAVKRLVSGTSPGMSVQIGDAIYNRRDAVEYANELKREGESAVYAVATKPTVTMWDV